jgi:thiol-disulfide isomerase/thioredoxin
MRKKFFAALALVVFFVASASAAPKKLDFESRTLNEEKVDQSIFEKSSLTVLNFWGTFCPPCLREMPSLGKLSRELNPSEVQIVGVVVDCHDADGKYSETQIEKALSLVKKTGADYTHILLSGSLFENVGGIDAVPLTCFVSRSGEVVDEVLGALSEDQWRSRIQQNLEKVK